MIQDASGDVTITNDGATILKQMSVLHPIAKMVMVTRRGGGGREGERERLRLGVGGGGRGEGDKEAGGERKRESE